MKKRYYLDTNVLIFALFAVDLKDNIDSKTEALLKSDNSELYTSSVALQEMLHLIKTGKIKKKKKRDAKLPDIFPAIKQAGITINYVTQKHYEFYHSKLEIDNDKHGCPFDHLIIAQAIYKIALISTDHKFPHYELQGLKLVRGRAKNQNNSY